MAASTAVSCASESLRSDSVFRVVGRMSAVRLEAEEEVMEEAAHRK